MEICSTIIQVFDYLTWHMFSKCAKVQIKLSLSQWGSWTVVESGWTQFVDRSHLYLILIRTWGKLGLCRWVLSDPICWTLTSVSILSSLKLRKAYFIRKWNEKDETIVKKTFSKESQFHTKPIFFLRRKSLMQELKH